MRLATFNVENMFERPFIMDLPTWDDGKVGLQDFSRLNELIQNLVYTEDDKNEMLTIMKKHKGLLTVGESKYIKLNEIRERLLKKQHGNNPAQIVANG